MEKRETFSSRLGFVLISAGCAIGLGNVWRFPYITGKYGGGAFVLLYLVFLVILGLPVMVMELSVGRASQRSIALSFKKLEPAGSKWHWYSYVSLAGNYLLMMFYTVIAGWLLHYFVRMLKGDFAGMDAQGVAGEFTALMGKPVTMAVYMALVVCIGMLVCLQGLRNGVERVNKAMMVCLLALMVVLAGNSVLLEGAGEGLRFYLQPNFHNLVYDAQGNWILGETVFAAMGQASACWTPAWPLPPGSSSSRPVLPLGSLPGKGPRWFSSPCPTSSTTCPWGGCGAGHSSCFYPLQPCLQ